MILPETRSQNGQFRGPRGRTSTKMFDMSGHYGHSTVILLLVVLSGGVVSSSSSSKEFQIAVSDSMHILCAVDPANETISHALITHDIPFLLVC